MAITNKVTLGAFRDPSRPRSSVANREVMLRLVGAGLIGLLVAIFVIGSAWDVQWHNNIGRDRALTPPHLVMLGAIALTGLISAALVLINTNRARMESGVNDDNSSRLFWVFRAPLGFAVSGFGALLAFFAFPLDNYWHSLYGIDVTFWAPFHVMIFTSMIMVGLGALYATASELNRVQPDQSRLPAQLGFAVSLSATWTLFMILMLPQTAAAEGLISLGSYGFVLYPGLLALTLPLGLLVAVRVTRLPGAATIVAVVYLAIRQLMIMFVLPAVAFIATRNGFTYRPGAAQFALVPITLPVIVLLAALLIDVAYWAARRQHVKNGILLTVIFIAAIASGLLDRPWVQTMTLRFYPEMSVNAVLLNGVPLMVVGALLGISLASVLSRVLFTIRK